MGGRVVALENGMYAWLAIRRWNVPRALIGLLEPFRRALLPVALLLMVTSGLMAMHILNTSASHSAHGSVLMQHDPMDLPMASMVVDAPYSELAELADDGAAVRLMDASLAECVGIASCVLVLMAGIFFSLARAAQCQPWRRARFELRALRLPDPVLPLPRGPSLAALSISRT